MGYYLLRDPRITVKDRGAYLIGDAAGLATEDLGEGIGPAVESGRTQRAGDLGAWALWARAYYPLQHVWGPLFRAFALAALRQFRRRDSSRTGDRKSVRGDPSCAGGSKA